MIVYMYSTQSAKSHLASCVCACVSTSPVDACYPIQYNLKRPGEELLGGSGGGGGGSAVNFPRLAGNSSPSMDGAHGGMGRSNCLLKISYITHYVDT